MRNKLQQLFPTIKSRKEIMEEIQGNDTLSAMFSEWTEEQQEEFLDFTTGVRGVKILYDSFFKEILNPETVPERLNDLLSLLLGKKVRILHVLPSDNSRLGDESSLVIMDIVVQLDDGANFCRNIFLFPLTYFMRAFKIKVSGTNLMHGWHFSAAMIRKRFPLL